jgi:SNF2 family DNA or RNA helicase
MTKILEKLFVFEKILTKTNMTHNIHQYEGIRWCLENELHEDPPHNLRGGIIADEMGLGKTIMMIGLCLCNPLSRTLIVVPPILVDQWYNQMYKITRHKALIYYGKNKKTITDEQLRKAPMILTTYGNIRKQNKKEYSKLHDIVWGRIIFDEAHHLKNKKTTTFKGAKKLKSKIKWLVTGTPIQNNKNDLYSLLTLIKMPISVFKDTDNLNLVKSFILRRTKKQLGMKICDLNEEKRVVKWSNNSEKNLAKAIHSKLKFSNCTTNMVTSMFDNITSISRVIRAKQMCIYPKMIEKLIDKMINNKTINVYDDDLKKSLNNSSKLDAVMKMLVQNAGNGSGKIVFCHFRDEINELYDRIKSTNLNMTVEIIDGRTSTSKRNEILETKYEVLLLQIQTGCEGLNLQENYSEIYFVSPHWNPYVEEQAIARCYRMGQRKPVYVYRFEMESFLEDDNIIKNNIDNHTFYIQDNKKMMVNELLNQ